MPPLDSKQERKKLFEEILKHIEPLLNEGRLEEASRQLARAREIDPNSIIVRHLEERVTQLKESLEPEESEDSLNVDQSLRLARLKYEEEARRLEEQRYRMDEARRRFEAESRMFEEQRHIAEEERIKYEVDRIKKERDAQNLSELRRRADIERRKYEEEVRKYEEQTFLGQESRFHFEEELRKREERKKQMLTEQRERLAERKKGSSPASQIPQTPPLHIELEQKNAATHPPKQAEIQGRKVEREYLQPIEEQPPRGEAPSTPSPSKKQTRQEAQPVHEQPISYRKQKSNTGKVIALSLAALAIIAGGFAGYYFLSPSDSPTLSETLAPRAPQEKPSPEKKQEVSKPQQQPSTNKPNIDTMVQSFFQKPETAQPTGDTSTSVITKEPEPKMKEPTEEKAAEIKEQKVEPKEPPKAPPLPKQTETAFPIEQEDPTLEEIGELTLHTVKSGETIESISRKYRVTLRQIMKWNALSTPKVKPKQDIYIFVRKK
jgi:LysM repeat protein